MLTKDCLLVDLVGSINYIFINCHRQKGFFLILTHKSGILIIYTIPDGDPNEVLEEKGIRVIIRILVDMHAESRY